MHLNITISQLTFLRSGSEEQYDEIEQLLDDISAFHFVHVFAKKLDSHFVLFLKGLNNEDDMGQFKYFITYYNKYNSK
jgi:hypothetical protein